MRISLDRARADGGVQARDADYGDSSVIAVDAPTPQVALAKVWAIFVRDARIALSYRANFFVQLASVAVSVVIAYFISIVAGHSVKVTVGTVTMSYFDYLAVNLAFVRFQSTGVQVTPKSFATARPRGRWK